MKNIFNTLFLLFLIFGSTSFAENVKDSIYQVDNTWMNSQGQEIKLDSFKGTPTFITMVYLSCPHTCPLTISKLKEIEKKLIAKKIQDYRFVLASFDFENDTPTQLKKMMQEKGLSEKHWTFLTAKNDEAVRALSIVLGISYKKLESGDYSHSNIINVLDGEGRILNHIDRLTANDDVLIQALEKKNGTQ